MEDHPLVRLLCDGDNMTRARELGEDVYYGRITVAEIEALSKETAASDGHRIAAQ